MTLRFNWKAFLTLFFINSLIWIILLGWHPDGMIAGGDAMLESIAYSHTLKNSGHWSALIYNFHIFGGTPFLGLFGFPFLNQILVQIKMPPVLAYNFSHLFLQTTIGFLGTYAIWSQKNIFNKTESKPPKDFFLKITTMIIVCFQPVLLWRLGWGHQNFLNGLLFTVSIFSFLSWPTHSRFMLLLIWLGLCQSLTSLGQQLIINSLYFILPLFFILLKDRRQRFGQIFLLLSSVAMVAAPTLLEMARIVFSQESRSLINATGIAYSYLPPLASDFLTFFFADPASISEQLSPFFKVRNEFFLFHESHYYLGATPFVLLVFGYLKKTKLLAACLLLISMVAILSFQWEPLATMAMDVLPMLSGLRTPGRAWILVAFILNAFFLSFMLANIKSSKKEDLDRTWLSLCFIILILLLLTLPPIQRDLLFLVFSIFMAFLCLRIGISGFMGRWVFLVFVIFHLSISQSYIRPRNSSDLNSAEISLIKNSIENKISNVNFPLDRISLGLNSNSLVSSFRNNTAWALGLYSFDGYFALPQNLGKLVSAIEKIPFNPTMNNVRIDVLRDPKIIQHLYNVCCQINLQPAQIQLDRSEEPLHRAWFPTSITKTRSFEDLLIKIQESLNNQIFYQQGFINSEVNNPVLQKLISDKESLKACSAAEVNFLEAAPPSSSEIEPEIQAQISSPSECLLILSLNYSKLLRVEARTPEGQTTELETFPVNGVLMGVVLPKQNSSSGLRLSIRTKTLLPEMIYTILQGLGVLVFVLFIFYPVPRRRHEFI